MFYRLMAWVYCRFFVYMYKKQALGCVFPNA